MNDDDTPFLRNNVPRYRAKPPYSFCTVARMVILMHIMASSAQDINIYT